MTATTAGDGRREATLVLYPDDTAFAERVPPEASEPATPHPGLHRFFQGATWLWAGIFLLLTLGLVVLMFTEPAGAFLMLSTVATIALVVAGTGASTLWFLSVLRKLGLRLRFASA